MNRGVVYEFQIKLRLRCFSAVYFSEYVSLSFFFFKWRRIVITFSFIYSMLNVNFLFFFFLLYLRVTYEILVASMRLKKLFVKL